MWYKRQGQSHPLECELPEDDDIETEAIIAVLQACPDTLDADLRFYTTEIAMHDLDLVREALGYTTLNLYGASYGTRAALTYLRLYPDRVRSVVLDAVVSPDYRLFLNTAQDADRALDLLFARCETDAACDEAFPDARDEIAALLVRLEEEPLTATLPDPISAAPITVTLDRADLLDLIFPLLYTPEIAALLPLNLQQVAAGNPAPLLTQVGAMDAGLYLGMFYAVACTEDAPFIDAAEAAALAEGALFGDRTRMLREVCTAWPQGDLSPDWDAPVVSDVPALLLSGEGDPVTPPQYAARVAETLPNSLHIIGPGMGHGLIGRGCIDTLVFDFITAGSVEGLHAACAQQLAPPPFFLSPIGPQP
jgi:pimeloyl-ACP methyl ester carboxylesterase